VPPLYDLMLMLDPNASDDRQKEIVAEAQRSIESEGSLVGTHDWGTRRLAYEIDHRGEAAYHLFQFEGPTSLLDRLDHSLKIADGVLRFRIIRLKPGTPPPQPPRAEPPRAREQRSDDTTVAARAAADAPAEPEPAAAEPQPAPAEPEPAAAAPQPAPAEPEPAAAEPQPQEAPASDEPG
jgi:small subunit ribosomal protein S6